MTDNSSAREDFEGWVAFMDEALEELMDAVPDETRSRLDFSTASLDALEAWLLHEFPSYEALIDEEAADVLDAASRYAGQTFIRQLGGQWDVKLDDPTDPEYSVPVLTGFRGERAPLSRITLVTASADRRTGTYLRTVLENLQRRAAAPT